jgi:hypothetical protein
MLLVLLLLLLLALSLLPLLSVLLLLLPVKNCAWALGNFFAFCLVGPFLPRRAARFSATLSALEE